MRQRLRVSDRRVGVIRGSAATVITGTVLSLVIWLPIDRATLVAGIVVSLVTSAAPAWLSANGSTAPRGHRRSSSGRSV